MEDCGVGEEVQFENSNDQEVAHAQSLQVPHGLARALTFQKELTNISFRRGRNAGWKMEDCGVGEEV
jgi:hypothetical protein